MRIILLGTNASGFAPISRRVLFLFLLRFGLKQLDVPLINKPNFGTSEVRVLLEDGTHGPALSLAKAAHEAPGAVLALVAVYQQRVVSRVRHFSDGRVNLVQRDVLEWVLVSLDPYLHQSDSVRLDKVDVGGRQLFNHKGQDGSEPQPAQKGKVLLHRESAAVDTSFDHGEISGREEIFEVFFLLLLSMLLLLLLQRMRSPAAGPRGHSGTHRPQLSSEINNTTTCATAHTRFVYTARGASQSAAESQIRGDFTTFTPPRLLICRCSTRLVR